MQNRAARGATLHATQGRCRGGRREFIGGRASVATAAALRSLMPFAAGGTRKAAWGGGGGHYHGALADHKGREYRAWRARAAYGRGGGERKALLCGATYRAEGATNGVSRGTFTRGTYSTGRYEECSLHADTQCLASHCAEEQRLTRTLCGAHDIGVRGHLPTISCREE